MLSSEKYGIAIIKGVRMVAGIAVRRAVAASPGTTFQMVVGDHAGLLVLFVERVCKLSH